MRFKVDENLPPFMAGRLTTAGFDAMTIVEQAFGGISDDRLVPLCVTEGRILVTLDLDFSDVRRYPPGNGPGFIVLRLERQDRSDFEAAAELLLKALAGNEVNGALWIVEKSRVRVRESGSG